MKNGKTLTELAAEIESQRKRKLDLVAPTTSLKAWVIENGPSRLSLSVEDKATYPMRDLALTQAAARVNIPLKYARLMEDENPQLLADNLNSWFQRKPERRLIRTLDHEARAFLSERYQRIDNYDVAEVSLKVLSEYPGLIMRSTEITEHRMYIKVSFPHLQRELTGTKRVGDVVEAGVVICNSEVGLGAVSATPYAMFLACLNGMVCEGAKRWNHVGRKIEGEELEYLSDETIRAGDRVDLMKLRDTIKHLLDEKRFETLIERIQGTVTQAITGRVSNVVQVLSEKIGLSDKEGDSVLQHLITGGDLSRFGLMNAVTRTAEDAPDYDRATVLEGFGHKIIELVANDWRQIAEAA